jgi:quinolinate synthase
MSAGHIQGGGGGGGATTSQPAAISAESIDAAFEFDDVEATLAKGGASDSEREYIEQQADDLKAMKELFMVDGELSGAEVAELADEAQSLDELVFSSIDMSKLSEKEQMAVLEFCGVCFEKEAEKAIMASETATV